MEKCQLLIVGDSLVGKTSMLTRFVHGTFNESYLATVGIDFFSKDVNYDGRKVRVKIWDTAGQERYKTLTKGFIRNAQGIIVVYDVTNLETFDNLKYWIQSLKSYASEENIQIPAILVGNKIDSPKREVEKESGIRLAKDNDLPYFETSALTGENIDLSIKELVLKVLNSPVAKNNDNDKDEYNYNYNSQLERTRTDKPKKTPGCCC